MLPASAGSVFLVPTLAKIGTHAAINVATHAHIIPVIYITSPCIYYCDCAALSASPDVPLSVVLSAISDLT